MRRITAAWIALGIGLALISVVLLASSPQRDAAEASASSRDRLRALFDRAQAYYAQTHEGADGARLTSCVVEPAVTPSSPGPESRPLPESVPESFQQLGMSSGELLRYQFEIASVGGCGHGPDETLYSFRAHGDLDGDGVRSLTEYAAGTSSDNELYRSPVPYIERQLE